ncbi:nose resistant to fluoxetine protein 6-like protein [Dinothrombium tinctorium]|uniref:Nose resistant to fluoxetine protein 6-like protein n=1 Tax=Dinothrombium tinctorium TaxID=1965070 RepID=A0A3S3P457_9ACAR|nr:nose resistant to fluoxetine protein 6-like protein [Dinothrombium tinctorium]
MGACVLIALLATATLVGSHTHEWMDDTTEKDDTIQFEHLVVEVNQSVDLQLPFDTLPVLLNNYRKQNKVYTNLQMNPNFVSIMASCLATGLISYENGLSVLFGIQAKFNLEHLDINEDKDKALDYLNKIYTKPWCRISSYLVGLLAGFLYYKYCRNPLRVKKYIIIIGSILATLLGLVVIYSTYHSTPTFLESALYNGLSRLAWALFIIWLIFMCMTRNCALVNNLLSCSFWFPLSRLTYCAYLIHPIVINAYYRNYKAPLMFSHRTIMAVVASALVYVYLTSFLLSILIEVPFRELEKKIFPQHKAAEDNESKVD